MGTSVIVHNIFSPSFVNLRNNFVSNFQIALHSSPVKNITTTNLNIGHFNLYRIVISFDQKSFIINLTTLQFEDKAYLIMYETIGMDSEKLIRTSSILIQLLATLINLKMGS